MVEKMKKAERGREEPRQIPTADAHHSTTMESALAAMLEGEPFEDAVFRDLDLSHRKIGSLRGSHLLFERVSFSNCDIGSIRLADVRFVECDFSNAQLRGFEASRMELLRCKLVGMNALACRWQDVLLDHCDARLAQFSEGRIRRSELRSTQMREAALNRVDFTGTVFSEVVLRQAELTSSKLTGLDLTTCDIEAITLKLEDLRGAIVNPAQAMQLARFLEVVIR